jgi:hypothetical protein
MGLFEWNAACCSLFYRLKSGDCEAWPVADVMESVDSLDYQLEWELRMSFVGSYKSLGFSIPPTITSRKCTRNTLKP